MPASVMRCRRARCGQPCALSLVLAAALAGSMIDRGGGVHLDATAGVHAVGLAAGARSSLRQQQARTVQSGAALDRRTLSQITGYSTVNGTVEIGMCDKHYLCRDIWDAYVDQQAFCPPGNVMCQQALSFRCVSRADVYERRGCELEDCLEVRSMLVDADSCAQWFPEIVETSLNRNPVENIPNPTQVRARVAANAGE
jgi:hypothetical protein